jgi:hypothetical protein
LASRTFWQSFQRSSLISCSSLPLHRHWSPQWHLSTSKIM